MLRDYQEEGEQVLKQLKISNDVKADLNQIQNHINQQKENKPKWSDLIRIPVNRKALFIGIGYQISYMSSFIDVMVVYLVIILEKTATPIAIQKFTPIIFAGCGVLMVMLSTCFVDSWGRRPLLLLSTLLTSTMLFLVGFYFFLIRFELTNYLTYMPMICLILYKISIGIGIASLARLSIGELFTTKFAPLGSCVCRTVYHIWALIILEIYPVLEDKFGMDVVLMVIAVFCMVYGLIFVLIIPETKNKSLPEIQEMLKYRNFFGGITSCCSKTHDIEISGSKVI